MTYRPETVGAVIKDILERNNISVRRFAQIYGKEGRTCYFSHQTVYRWMKGEGFEKGINNRLIEALADVGGVTFDEITQRFGQGVTIFSGRESNEFFEILPIWPLMKHVGDDPKLREAIRVSIRGRRAQCIDGTLQTARDELELGAQLAVEAKAPRVATYIKTYLCNVNEMLSNFDAVGRLVDEISYDADRFRREAEKTQDRDLEQLSHRFRTQSKLLLLWSQWARGVTPASVPEAEALLQDLEQHKLYQSMPYLLEFLARCFMNLGDVENGLRYIERAETCAYALRHAHRARYELFLDAGGALPTGKLDYRWQDDQILAAKVDLLIAAGKPEEAFESYRLIQLHKSPASHLSLHNWFNPAWQEVIQRQTVLTAETDEKLGYDFQDYDEELEASNDRRIQALNTYAAGEYESANGDLLMAGMRFQQAYDLAATCHADDVTAKSAIAGSRTAIRQNRRSHAQKLLGMIQMLIHRINNPAIEKDYHNVEEEIA